MGTVIHYPVSGQCNGLPSGSFWGANGKRVLSARDKYQIPTLSRTKKDGLAVFEVVFSSGGTRLGAIFIRRRPHP